MLKKTRKTLYFCQAIGDGWSEAIRTGIYKVFIRPVLEYGLPIYFFYQQFAGTGTASPSIKSQVATIDAMLKEEHLLALSWIFNVRKPRKIHASLAGMPLYAHRLKYLAGSLILHLDRAPETTVLALRRKDSRNFTGVTRLLRLTHRLDWVTEFHRLPPVNGKTQSWSSFGKGKLMDLLTNAVEYGTMANVCTKKSRNSSGMDLTLLIYDRDVRKLAIAWRCNVFPRGSKCPECTNDFDRGHANHLMERYERSYPVLGKLKRRFEMEVSARRLKHEKHHYTWLDFLLNEGLYKLFDQVRQATSVTFSPRRALRDMI
jgi:hypothetical protein